MSVARGGAATIPGMCSIGSDKTSSVAFSTPVGVGPGVPTAGSSRPGVRATTAGVGRATLLTPRGPFTPGGSVISGRVI